MSYFRRMIDAVGDLDFTDDPVDEFANGAFVILAAALAKLPEWKREVWLHKIEGGDLRRAAPRFFGPGVLPLPKAGNGHDTY
jgi:hypothetical protein